MGMVLAAGLLLIAVPMTAVALGAGRRTLPLVEIQVQTQVYDKATAA